MLILQCGQANHLTIDYCRPNNETATKPSESGSVGKHGRLWKSSLFIQTFTNSHYYQLTEHPSACHAAETKTEN